MMRGHDCEDPPGVREGPAGEFNLACLRDPDGNKICIWRQTNQPARSHDVHFRKGKAEVGFRGHQVGF